MIPIQWSDQTLAAINYLRGRPSLSGVTITRTKQAGKVEQIVLDTEPQQFETLISRRTAVLLESWAERANGSADVSRSFEIMSVALFELQRAPDLLPHVVRFDSPVGPRVEKDDAGFEYHEGSLVWVVSQ